jgi:hypothetical protein
MVNISIWENDNVSGVELEGLPIRHFDDGLALNQQMVEQKMWRSGSERTRHLL